jgi:polar amino acid transport system substrate-binding protein
VLRTALTLTLATALAVLATVAGAPAAPSRAAAVCAMARYDTTSSGKLTVGTDNPAYPPWFGGGSPKGSKWKINDPSTGKGFESAVAYAVAGQLGFGRSEVQWTYVPFNRAFAPGPKPFDFDINQISFTPARAKVVTFSASYYDVNQALVVLKGSKIAAVRSVAGLRKYKLGAQLGTTSYAYIKERVTPSSSPAVDPANASAIQALKNKQIDGLVVDLPTAFYVTAVQIEGGAILQFPAVSGGEHFGMVFPKGSSLAPCVNRALANLKANGTLKRIQQQWLAKATGAPVLK